MSNEKEVRSRRSVLIAFQLYFDKNETAFGEINLMKIIEDSFFQFGLAFPTLISKNRLLTYSSLLLSHHSLGCSRNYCSSENISRKCERREG
jgi:hypothetical protein